MILDTFHFSKKIENIDQILLNEELEIVSLQKRVLKNFEKEEINDWYISIFQNFPLTIENSSKEIGISIFATELLDLYYDIVESNVSITNAEKREIFEKRENFEPKNNTEVIHFFIDTFLNSLIYDYEYFLANTMKQYYFIGINDEIKILLNILNRYKNVLKDKTKQIEIFWCIRLNKQLSDLVLDMLIEFIEQRLNLLTISTENIHLNNELAYVENDIFNIGWNGTQQELCELISELEKKEWISKIKTGDRRKFANSITKIFNLSNTKKNKKSNTSNSFYQLLKGEYENNERIYPFMEKENYERKFNGIKSKKL